MSLAAYRAVWTRSRAKGSMQHLLLAFAEFANETGVGWPSVATIAERLQVTYKNASKRVAEAVEAGELIRVGTGKRGVVIYRLACCDAGYVGREPPSKSTGVADREPPSETTGVAKPTPLQIDRGCETTTPVVSAPTPVVSAPNPPPNRQTNRKEPSKNRKEEAAAVEQAAFDLWNQLCESTGLKPVARLTTKRRDLLRARLAECGGYEGWAAALLKIDQTPGLRGQGSRGFCVEFEWLLDETNLAKILEGKYDDWGSTPANGGHAGKPASAGERTRRALAGLHAAVAGAEARRRSEG